MRDPTTVSGNIRLCGCVGQLHLPGLCPQPLTVLPPDMELTERGGKQSASPYFPRGLPPLALLRVSRILKEGAIKYEKIPFPEEYPFDCNWDKISAGSHLDHLLVHVFQVLKGDISEDHAGHLALRALFFLDMRLRESGEEP